MRNDEWKSNLEAALKAGMTAAAERAGRYGGRYVAEQALKANKTSFTPHRPSKFIVLDDDDPEKFNKRLDVDIIAQCLPDKVYAIGRARNYINEDGSVRLNY